MRCKEAKNEIIYLALLIAGLCGLMNSAIAAPLIERIGAPLSHPWAWIFWMLNRFGH